MAAMFRQILEYFRSQKDVWFAHSSRGRQMDGRSEDRGHILRQTRFLGHEPYESCARALSLMLACLIALASEALAQADYPSRPVRHHRQFRARRRHRHPGARAGAAAFARRSQNFFVENRGGGGGILGIEAVQHAPADGYTLLMTPSTVTVLPAVSRQARYDATKDFAAITQVAGISNVLVVHPDVPAHDAAGADRAGEGQARPAQLRARPAPAARRI